jgi:Flp pilus assembly protein TadG
MPARSQPRSAAVQVETAIVLPIFLLVVLGLLVGGMGVFRYQQVACLAREVARRACVSGGDYQKDTNQPSPTRDQLLQQTVLPLAVGMDPEQVGLTVVWIDQGNGSSQDWDAAPKDVKSITASGEYVNNTVRVTVTYNWAPGLFVGSLTLTSTCELPMSF